MKKINSILILGTLCLIYFAACKKTDNGPDLSIQERQLTSHIWQLKSLTIPATEDPSVDSSITQPCSDSALMAFDINKVYQLADVSKGGCDSAILPYSQGNWALSAGNDTLWLQSSRNLAWKLTTLNDTLLKATFRDSISPTENWLKTITLKK
jgi:hypothetical protein